MTRVQRSLLGFLLVGLGGGLLGWYVLKNFVKTPELRRTEEIDQQRLFDFGRKHLTRIQVSFADAKRNWTAEIHHKETGQWAFSKPLRWPVEADEFNGLLDRLAGARFLRVFTPSASQDDLTEAGLAPPAVAITFSTAKDGEKRLLLSQQNPITGMIAISLGEGNPIGFTEAGLLQGFEKPVSQLWSTKVLAGLEPENLTQLTILKNDKQPHLSLRKEASGWEVQSGGQWWPANPGETQLLLVALSKRLTTEGVLEPLATPESLAKRRLEPALAYVVYKPKSGPEITIRFSRVQDSPGLAPRWVAYHENWSPIVEVPSWIGDELLHNPQTLRDLRLSRLDPKQVAKVKITYGTDEQVLSQNADGTWKLGSQPADSARVTRTINGFERLTAEDAVTMQATRAQLEKWFLDPPSRRFAFYDKDGAFLSEVRFGTHAKPGFLYASTGGSKVLVIPTTLLQGLPEKLSELVAR